LRWGTEWINGGTDFTYAESTGMRTGGYSGFRRRWKNICYESERNEGGMNGTGWNKYLELRHYYPSPLHLQYIYQMDLYPD